MKSKLRLLLSALLITVFLAGCNTTVSNNDQPEAAEKKTVDANHKIEDEPLYGKSIKIGYNGGLCTGTAGIAYAQGYFEEEGLDVEIVNAQSINDAIGTGQVVMGTNHISSMLVPTINGLNMTFLKGAQTGCKSLYVLKDSGIESTKDLIGKSVAVPNGFGESDHNIGLRFFHQDGIDTKDVDFKVVETSASILSMQNGEIQGAVLTDQFAEEFINDGTLKVIRSLTWDEDFKQEPCCIHAFNTDFVEQNPLIAEKMVKAINKSSEYIANNIEDATQILFDNNWASGDFDQAVRMMESYNWIITDDMAETALRDIIKDYKTFGLINSNQSDEELMEKVWSPQDI